MYGKTIKKLMKEHSFDTTYELAKKAGITPPGLKNILNDTVKKPQRANLEKLGNVFGLTVVELKAMASKEV
jgi:transcriptional regulator with XRE-family HTH domain